MAGEMRTVHYDEQLKIEAYTFRGVMQQFPNHFHEYYVLGFIEDGRRHLTCGGKEYIVGSGDLLMISPQEPHTCRQLDERPLDYRCLNIPVAIMEKTAEEITGTAFEPRFCSPVAYKSELAPVLRELHGMIEAGEGGLQKEELFFLLIEQVLEEHMAPAVKPGSIGLSEPMQKVRDYLDTHYQSSVTLDELAQTVHLSKYHLIRSFTKEQGISPYSYLEAVRIGKAKALLEQGTPPIEAAMACGFTDQSHFTNFFKRLIGLTPHQYRKIFQ